MPMSMPKRKAMKIQHFHCASVTPGKSISLAPIALVHGKTRGLCLCCAEDKAYALAVPRKSSICLSPWRCGTNEVRAMPFHITAACSLRQLRKTLNNSSGAVRDDQCNIAHLWSAPSQSDTPGKKPWGWPWHKAREERCSRSPKAEDDTLSFK